MTPPALPVFPPRRRPVRAFTLVEMLVVMTIILIIVGLVVPVMRNILGSNQLTDATDRVVGQLKYGDQMALSKNLPIEVRFYEYNDATVTTTPPSIRAIQLWQLNQNGTRTPLAKPQLLPGTTIVSVDSRITNLGSDLSSNSLPASETPVTLPASYTYKSFQFQPDGSTTLALVNQASPTVPLQWFCTLKNAIDQAYPPTDFATVQIEPVTGEIRVFRR